MGSKVIKGLPWWSSGLKSSCQYREPRFNPWSGKIPHATGQLSSCASTTEARAPRACALQQEKPLLAATRESLGTAMKTQCSQKQINEVLKKSIEELF